MSKSEGMTFTVTADHSRAMRKAAKALRDGEISDIGHNVGGIPADRLRSIVNRVERVEEERKGLAGDIKDIFAEAKSAGFDVKVLRRLIADRKQDGAAVEEFETLLATYKRAMEFGTTPLGATAEAAAA